MPSPLTVLYKIGMHALVFLYDLSTTDSCRETNGKPVSILELIHLSDDVLVSCQVESTRPINPCSCYKDLKGTLCLILNHLSFLYRTDGLLAILVTDRDGVPIIKCKLA